jgi:hypothetical protein
MRERHFDSDHKHGEPWNEEDAWVSGAKNTQAFFIRPTSKRRSTSAAWSGGCYPLPGQA